MEWRFWKKGASPDSMKVEAIKQAEPPRNAKELNSFLCTAQYNFIYLFLFISPEKFTSWQKWIIKK